MATLLIVFSVSLGPHLDQIDSKMVEDIFKGVLQGQEPTGPDVTQEGPPEGKFYHSLVIIDVTQAGPPEGKYYHSIVVIDATHAGSLEGKFYQSSSY